MTGSDSATALSTHLQQWRAANDAEAPQPVSDVAMTPLMRLATALPSDNSLRDAAAEVTLRRFAIAFETRAPAHAVWSSIAAPELLLSDSRRIAPRFRMLAMNGGMDAQAGDHYRLEDARPARRAALGDALRRLAPGGPEAPARRRCDIVLARCGPFAGETGEIVADAALNHARAGRSALWVLIHADVGDRLRVTLDAAEIARWNWAPDALADLGDIGDIDDGIVDWPWLFERLVAAADGEFIVRDTSAEVSVAAAWPTLTGDARLREALRLHPALAETAALLKA